MLLSFLERQGLYTTLQRVVIVRDFMEIMRARKARSLWRRCRPRTDYRRRISISLSFWSIETTASEGSVGYALEILAQQRLYELRGDFLIEVHDLTFPAELRTSPNSSKWAYVGTAAFESHRNYRLPGTH